MLADAPYADRYFTVSDGLRLHYREYPGSTNKPPLLCLHGLTRNSRDFADFAERYSPSWRALALDFRGRGRSDYDPLPARYNPLTYAGDVIQLLDALGLPQAVFVGTSLGGLVTMAIAAGSPDRIAAAILNDVGPDIDPSGIARILSYVGKDKRFTNWDEAAETIASNNDGAFESYSHEDWVSMAKRNCREENGEIRFDYDMAIAEPFKAAGPIPKVDLWPFFGVLAQKPLLVVRGERSDLLTTATAARMQEAAPGMRLVTVAGVGHAPDLNEEEAIAAIDDFLAGIEI
jgi:pimeloyl-ACP methyl ester carboxylesterase